MKYHLLDSNTGNRPFTDDAIASFLFEHLDRFGDARENILKAIAYVNDPHRGGFILVGTEGEKIVGAVVVNRTGMSGYIPENILVYIAVHRDLRGQGVGRKLMERAIATAEGAIALHVEADNPAAHLYRKLGFTNKYLEMRLQKPTP